MSPGSNNHVRGTDPSTSLLRALRDALAAGAARIEGRTEAASQPETVDVVHDIGFMHQDGIALLPRSALEAAHYWARTRLLSEAEYTAAEYLNALYQAGHLQRWNRGRLDYQVRRGNQRLRVWLLKPEALGLLSITMPARTAQGAAPPGDDGGPQIGEREAERPSFYRGSFGFYIPQALSRVDARMIDTLRFVGRVKYATHAYIARFAYPSNHSSSVYRALAYLVANDLLWVVPGRQAEFVLERPVQDHTTPSGRKPSIYGLTPRGKEWLATNGRVEVDDRHYRVLKERDLATQPLPIRQMSHDMQVAWWLASAVTALKRNRWCHGVYLETEFTVGPDQRIDAYLDIRINHHVPRQDMSRFWHDGESPRPDEVSVKLALEVDNDTEAPKIIHLKGWTYAQNSYNAVYDWLFSGPVIPVFIVPTVARKQVVMREFSIVWPRNWGIAATSRDCDDPDGGTLWGYYHRMNELPEGEEPEEMLPLTVLGRSPSNTITWRPALTEEQWVLGMVEPPAPKHLPLPAKGRRYGPKPKRRRRRPE